MDPLGIALENYDVIGRWRDQYTDVINYGITREDGTGLTDSFPVDTKTAHMDGRTFEGPLGLWQGAGLILGVLLGSKRGHFEGSKPYDFIGRANRISIFRILDTRHENLRFWLHFGWGGASPPA